MEGLGKVEGNILIDMTKNPIVNALVAFGYIVLVVLIMGWGTKLHGYVDNTLMAPLVVISLFTLSAGVMACVFCYQPSQLFFDGKKKQAVDLFLKTVGAFGVITVIILSGLFTGLFSKK